MDFVEATCLHAKTVTQEQAFLQACKAQVTEMEAEINGVMGIFKNVLATTPADAIHLPTGHYLYMKTHQSMRVLNEERLCLAIENITLEQLRRIVREWEVAEKGPATVLTTVCASIQENLFEECVQTTHTPMLAKRRAPSALSIMPSHDAILIEAVQTYLHLKGSLAALRRHKNQGQQRCTAIKKMTTPILATYLQSHSLKKQEILFHPTPPLLPSLPTVTMPNLCRDDPIAAAVPIPTAIPAAATPILQVGPTAAYEVQQRTYTSRGKAPRFDLFTEQLPCWTAVLVPPTQPATEPQLKKIILPDMKKKLLDLLLKHYHDVYAASKGTPKQKIHIAMP